MNALITLTPLTIQNMNQQGVDARLLHTRLGVRRDFSHWINDRINKYGFIENQDFVVSVNSGENLKGGRPANDYTLTLDMAKELCMVQNNEAGRKTRRYFIEVEKEFHAPTEQYGNPIQFNIPALQAMIDGALERQLAPLMESFLYKVGEQKGESKEVATGKQAGRIISMLEKLEKKLPSTVSHAPTPALPLLDGGEEELYDIHSKAVETMYKLSNAALKYKQQAQEQGQILHRVREATQQLSLIA
jgi:phage anti-repressor protein